MIQRQFGQQHVNRAFAAEQSHRFRLFANRGQQAVGKGFRDNISDADAQNGGWALLAQRQSLFHFPFEMEDFFRIGQRQASGIGQFKAAPQGAEQGCTNFVFQLAKLCANCLWCEVKLFCGPAYTAKSCNRPEVMEMLVVHVKISDISEILSSKIRVFLMF